MKVLIVQNNIIILFNIIHFIYLLIKKKYNIICFNHLFSYFLFLVYYLYLMDNLQQKVDLGKIIKEKSEEVFNKVMNDCLFNNFQNIENTINLIKKQFEEIKNNFLNELKSNIEQWEKTKEIYNKKEKNLLIQNITSLQIFQKKLMDNKKKKRKK